MNSESIAVILPCYNEALTIGKVIDDFHRELPQATVYVYDNNSSDDTSRIATEHGATVRFDPRQGKGNVCRQMFRDIDADAYVMVDGDDTYPAEALMRVLQPVLDGRADMVIGDRLSNGSYERENRRNFHSLGNNLVRSAVNRFFGTSLSDIMTGYRAFSRRFVKNFPALSGGFQLETEMTIFALSHHMRIVEVPIDFTERPEGSFSKLSTFRDGAKVLLCIFNMYRHYRPLAFFSWAALLLALFAIAVGVPVVIEYVRFHFVYKVPSAVLASGLFGISVMVFLCGVILDTISHNERAAFERQLKNRNT